MLIRDRTGVALGGQANNRPLSAILYAYIHYSGVARALRRFITNHENHWRNTLGWRRGGYHFYIDADGNIHQNYNYATQTNGVGGHNYNSVHICVEANSPDDYSEAQLKALDWLLRKVMGDLNIPNRNVLGHKEAPTARTACPGFSVARLNQIRQELANPAKRKDGNGLETRCITYGRFYEKPTTKSKMISTKRKGSHFPVEQYVYGESLEHENIWWYKTRWGYIYSGHCQPNIDGISLNRAESIKGV